MKKITSMFYAFVMTQLLTLPLQSQNGTVLYDVNFGTPPHTVGLVPATGGGPAPRKTVTSTVFGNPKVQATFEDLTVQPLVFDTYNQTNYDQIEFRIDFPETYEVYNMDVDITIKEMLEQNLFTILFDLPYAYRIDFYPSGEIIDGHLPPDKKIIGKFSYSHKLHFAAIINIVDNTITLQINSSPVVIQTDAGISLLRSIRFSAGKNIGETNYGLRAGIDNVVVKGKPAGLPDLIVESLTHSPANPTRITPITFTAVVKNIGNASSGPSVLDLKVGGETNGKKYVIPSLGPGESNSVTRVETLNVTQNYRNTATADYKNSVIESNEENNQKTDDYRVPSLSFVGFFLLLALILFFDVLRNRKTTRE